MPIYQYDCGRCGRRVDLFFRSVAKAASPRCPECDSKRLRRVLSPFARGRSDAERLDSIDVEQELGHMESSDIGGFARWAHRMGERMDGELGSDFRAIAERAEAGEDPIERVDPAHTLRHRVNRRREQVAGGDAAPAVGDGGDA